MNKTMNFVKVFILSAILLLSAGCGSMVTKETDDGFRIQMKNYETLKEMESDKNGKIAMLKKKKLISFFGDDYFISIAEANALDKPAPVPQVKKFESAEIFNEGLLSVVKVTGKKKVTFIPVSYSDTFNTPQLIKNKIFSLDISPDTEISCKTSVRGDTDAVLRKHSEVFTCKLVNKETDESRKYEIVRDNEEKLYVKKYTDS